jgi:lysozyme family protein
MLRGRIDKRFCDDYCRSAYNNQQYQQNRGLGFVRRVNNVLRKNRRILEELVPAGAEMAKVPKSRLVKKGFNFNYLTCEQASGAEGVVYQFCYEYGYLAESDCYIIKKEEKMKIIK